MVGSRRGRQTTGREAPERCRRAHSRRPDSGRSAAPVPLPPPVARPTRRPMRAASECAGRCRRARATIFRLAVQHALQPTRRPTNLEHSSPALAASRLNLGVSPRTTKHFGVAARRFSRLGHVGAREGALARWPGRHRPTRAMQHRSRSSRWVGFALRAAGARAPGRCAGRDAPRPESARLSRSVGRRAIARRLSTPSAPNAPIAPAQAPNEPRSPAPRPRCSLQASHGTRANIRCSRQGGPPSSACTITPWPPCG